MRHAGLVIVALGAINTTTKNDRDGRAGGGLGES
jgi:hypothetical protein